MQVCFSTQSHSGKKKELAEQAYLKIEKIKKRAS